MRIARLALLLSTAAAGCGIPEEQYNARVNELGKIKADLDAERKARDDAKKSCAMDVAALQSQNALMKGRLEALGQNVKDLEQSKSTLASDLDRTTREKEELLKAREAQELRAKQFRDLINKFKSMVDSGKLKVEIRNGLMLVKLADNILFDPGRTELKQEGKDAIKEVSQILAGIEGRKFQVAGHTDNKQLSHHSTYKSNWELSAARAVEVVHFMIDEGGMPGERVSAAGFADQLPVAPNDTEEGRKQNRRIEIVLLPNIEELPTMDDPGKDSSKDAAGAPAATGSTTPASTQGAPAKP